MRKNNWAMEKEEKIEDMREEKIWAYGEENKSR
jgi:hypothetical protein